MILVFAWGGQPVQAAGQVLLQGRILNSAGEPVAGAELYLYQNRNVKRPADFISSRTETGGEYQVVLPRGRYWAVAFQRRDGRRFGPLAPEDRHSGEPEQLDLEEADEYRRDFTVFDLREAAHRYQKRSEELVKISGRIMDADGRPVAGAYVMADRQTQFTGFPDFLSAWSGRDGGYTLYLPPGHYYLGAARTYPPPATVRLSGERRIDTDVSGLDIATQ